MKGPCHYRHSGTSMIRGGLLWTCHEHTDSPGQAVECCLELGSARQGRARPGSLLLALQACQQTQDAPWA